MASMNTYMQQAQRLLRDMKVEAINTGDLLAFVNEARVRLCAETECLRFMGTLALTSANAGPYAFSSITIPNQSTLGVGGILNVRLAWYQLGSGLQRITTRSWEWFALYDLNTPVPNTGGPETMAQYAQGAAGSLYFSPVPDDAYTVQLDMVCYPVDLAGNATVEAIPVMFTYAVPYYATYLAMLSMETGAKTEEADRMMKRYMELVTVARAGATPSVLPIDYPQVPNPTQVNQLGAQR